MLRFYFDEDAMRKAGVAGLRARGIDVRTALEEGMINRDDSDHLECATRLGRVLYSYNVKDYRVIHRTWLESGRSHAGILVCPNQRISVGDEVRAIARFSSAQSARRLENQLEFLIAG